VAGSRVTLQTKAMSMPQPAINPSSNPFAGRGAIAKEAVKFAPSVTLGERQCQAAYSIDPWLR
jgi:hypothetical protein